MAATADAPTAVDWTNRERRAWSWPEKLTASEWCERAPVHVPDNAINPEPGPYSFSRTPYLRGIIDTIVGPDVAEVWVYKPTQVGFTRLLMNFIGYCVDQDPGALGLLMPDEDSVEEIFAEELKPTIDATPALRRHKSGRAWDNTVDEIWLGSMPIFGLYAGSVQRLSRRSLRYVLADEVDKYRPFKNEASPLLLLKKRTSNWLHRARFIAGSTPTTRDGNIAAGYEACPDKREYFCRCPLCGNYELWQWSGVKGFRDAPGATKAERGNHVRLNKPAYYECGVCRGHITDMLKTGAVARGVWVSGASDPAGNGGWRPVQSVNPDGTLDGDRRPSARVGFHLSSLLSPWLTFSDLAAEFIEAEGDRDKTRDFRNARLALPWDEVVKSVRPSAVRDKREISPAPKMMGGSVAVPRWAVTVIATADTQKDWFAVALRAWGWGYKSQLIWYGECQTFDELYRVTLEARVEAEAGGTVTPIALLIDSGGTRHDESGPSRTDEVYQFAMRDERIRPVKGASHHMRKPWSLSQLANGVQLIVHDPGHYKDMLARLLADPDQTKWLPHRDVTEQYCLEMASEHKIVNPKTKRVEWAPTGSVRREAWDVERLQCLGADMANVGLAAPPESRGGVNPDAAPPPGDNVEYASWMNRHKRW